MLNALRVITLLLRGRVRLWQCYTNVTWRTCAACLRWHGRIVADPSAFPDHDGCEHKLLQFPVWKLAAFREKGRRMAERAEAELTRRKLFQEAILLLPQDGERAAALFDQAGAVDVYLPELERLAAEQAPLLQANPALRSRLGEVFLYRWKAKFAKDRYERQPELARTQQERWGVQRIKELFP